MVDVFAARDVGSILRLADSLRTGFHRFAPPTSRDLEQAKRSIETIILESACNQCRGGGGVVDVGNWLFYMMGRFGVPYLVTVALLYALFRVGSPRFKRMSENDFFLFTLPIILYLLLVWFRDRQGVNAGYANLAVAAAVVLSMFFRAAARWRPATHILSIVALGCGTAVLSWLLVPFEALVVFDRLF